MRICHVVETASGGAANVVIDLARFGVSVNDDVTVVHGPRRISRHFEAAARSIQGLKTITTPMRREIGIHDLTDLWLLYRVLRREGPFDVIHGHSSKAGALIRILGPLFPKAIKVYTPHAFITLDPKAPRIYRLIERGLSWSTDVIITVSKGERQHAIHDLKIGEKKVALIVNGVDNIKPAGRAEARDIMGYGAEVFVVGFVGRFAGQKNPERAIAAFAIAASRRSDLRLALISDGQPPTDLLHCVVREDLACIVNVFTGYSGFDLMAGLDCLLCTSDYEGFPLVFIEALAAGVPIVTTPVGGSHEAVIDGKTGHTADFSPEGLADSVGKLASLSRAARAEISENCRGHARQFDVRETAAATRLCYRCLLDWSKGREFSDHARVQLPKA